MSKLHPKVQEFKEFVKRHPKMVEEVRANTKTWQDFFEDWYMFGEDDDMWTKYLSGHNEIEKEKEQKATTKDSDLMGQIFSLIKNVDMNEMQKHINNVSGAISNVQQLIREFQGSKQNSNQSNNRPHPFSFQKD
ncbi:YlbD family protein [Bacillus sp. Marseille-P3661]|uniref:YlbD family protein n=1 Tax=Bacillus sp. Marseille-P3661 TaxID=1936234 RepID=UPI000C820EEC|nr:YlbD family protein [Bacillus sp. Marseille-P3661]